jgi:hypothetical protein
MVWGGGQHRSRPATRHVDGTARAAARPVTARRGAADNTVLVRRRHGVRSGSSGDGTARAAAALLPPATTRSADNDMARGDEPLGCEDQSRREEGRG